MQIDFLLYEKALKSMFGSKTIEQIKRFLLVNLVCHKCLEVKSDIEFSKAKAFPNRRHRFPRCKSCSKVEYDKVEQKKKGKDGHGNNNPV